MFDSDVVCLSVCVCVCMYVCVCVYVCVQVCVQVWLCSKNRHRPIRDSKASVLNLKSCVVLAKRRW